MSEKTKTGILPQAFLDRMKHILGEQEYQEFLKSYEKGRSYGLRLNTAKISPEEFEAIVPFPTEPVPWAAGGYFYPEDFRPSRCPLYQAGLYYLQEPSAMTPASCLPIEPGESVLDLCAAPGGKATALGAKLKGQGLLVANDISASRARALLRNLELFGISNAFVTNETPARLAESFPGFFHKILLDAPCSGEGMFRKEDALAKDWTPEKSAQLAEIQRELLLLCADMLRPGGLLLYSTCTFAPQEDEGSVAYLLRERPELEVLDLPQYEGFSPGRPEWLEPEFSPCRTSSTEAPASAPIVPPLTEVQTAQLKKCVRIFPHKMDGEGHFMALLRKPGKTDFVQAPASARPNANTRKWAEEFFREIGLRSLGGQPLDWNRVETRGDKVYYLPPVNTAFRGLNFLRNGLYLGDLKKNRFEPSQPFALALHKGDVGAVISLPASDPRLERYLKGETIAVEPGEAANSKGWHLLCVEGYPLGFGKLVNGTLKNKYPAGWRL